jgi:hypothetical protein
MNLKFKFRTSSDPRTCKPGKMVRLDQGDPETGCSRPVRDDGTVGEWTPDSRAPFSDWADQS